MTLAPMGQAWLAQVGPIRPWLSLNGQPGRPQAADWELGPHSDRFLAPKVARMDTDSPWGSFGASFTPNGRFSTHFRSNLMFWDPTGALASRDLDLAWLWILDRTLAGT